MVRTKADNSARKAVAGKAPRKGVSSGGGAAASGSPANGKAGKNGGGGGNPVCVRPTPEWQKGIDGFMTKTPKGKGSESDDVSDKVATENIEDVNMDDCAAVAESSCSESSVLTEAADGAEACGSSEPERPTTSRRRRIIVDDDDDE